MTDPSPTVAGWREQLAALAGRRWLRWARDLVLLLAVLLALGAWQSRGHLQAGATPEVTFRTLAGAPVALSSLRGRPLALAFWAPWCSVCKTESQNLSWTAKLVGDRARVVSVAAAFEDVAQVKAYMADQGVDYPVLLADDAALRALDVDLFPTVYLLDGDGRVKRSVSGYTTTLGLVARLLW